MTAAHNTSADAHGALFSAKADAAALTAHTGNANNPHSVTAAQIGAYTQAQTDALLETKTPIYGKGVNLLDNWYFGNADAIIDQRGGYVLINTATYYTDSALTQNPVTVSAYTTVYAPDVQTNYVGFYLTSDTRGTKYYASRTDCVRGYLALTNYGIDRWTSINVNIVSLIEESQLAVYPFDNIFSVMGQAFETPCAGKFTFSLITGTRIDANSGDFMLMTDLDGLESVSINFPKPLLPNTLYSVTFTNTFNRLRIYGANYNEWTIKAVKLELGDTQTLAHYDETAQKWVLNDPPPNYQQELAKCQRYFVRFGGDGNAFCPLTTGIATDTTTIRACIDLPVPLRGTPSIYAPNGILISGDRVELLQNPAIIMYSGLKTVGKCDIMLTSSNLTPGAAYELCLNDGHIMDFDANL